MLQSLESTEQKTVDEAVAVASSQPLQEVSPVVEQSPIAVSEQEEVSSPVSTFSV